MLISVLEVPSVRVCSVWKPLYVCDVDGFSV